MNSWTGIQLPRAGLSAPPPLQPRKIPPAGKPAREERPPPRLTARPAEPADLQQEADRVILARYSPAGVVVNANLEVLYFRGHTGPYLEHWPGTARCHLLQMLREGLLAPVRSALARAKKQKRPVQVKNATVRREGKGLRVNVEVIPLAGLPKPFFLVLFEPARLAAAPAEEAPAAAARQDRARRAGGPPEADRLTRELGGLHAYLQDVTGQNEQMTGEIQEALEDARLSNEELQSTNEELDTAMEELKSTNDELLAANEELNTRIEELHRSNSDLSNVFSAVRLGIVVLSREGRIRRFTPQAGKLFNLAGRDVGRRFWDLRPNLQAAGLEQWIRNAMASFEPKEQEVQDLAGRWYLLRVLPYHTAEGQIDGAVLVAVDIDPLKRSEQELAARSARLQEVVGELEAFAYSLAHDMRAPLRAMIGFAQLAATEAGEGAKPQVKDYLQRVVSGAKRQDQFIQDVLTYSRLVRTEVRLETIDLDALVREVIAERPEFQPPRAEVEIRSPLLPVRAHAAYLTQCLTNLLGNAVKFVKRGTVPRVVMRTEARDGKVRLWIEDNGIGIDPGSRERIFAIFERGHPHEQYEGTGIGLAIVRKAVERMGGQAGVESEPGRGSRFWIELQRPE